MKKRNYMKMEIPSWSMNVAPACSAISGFVSQMCPNATEFGDIKVAFREALTNAIDFAYPDTIGKISITASIFEGDVLEIKIRDWGCGINDVHRAHSPLFSTDEDNHSGMGFTIMEAFMDKLTVRSNVGKGTIVTMKKYILGNS